MCVCMWSLSNNLWYNVIIFQLCHYPSPRLWVVHSWFGKHFIWMLSLSSFITEDWSLDILKPFCFYQIWWSNILSWNIKEQDDKESLKQYVLLGIHWSVQGSFLDHVVDTGKHSNFYYIPSDTERYELALLLLFQYCTSLTCY